MAHIYDAVLKPGKMELISAWLPQAPWFTGTAPVTVEPVGSFRFDDPEGQVGIETHLVAVGTDVFQVPLTYRGAPLPGADDFLITTMEHSVLGRRWVYDACGDPVYAQALAGAILAAEGQARQCLEKDGAEVELPADVRVTGSGLPDGGELAEGPGRPPADLGISTLRTGDWQLAVVRMLELEGETAPDPSLTAEWDGQDIPVVLAWAVPTQ